MNFSELVVSLDWEFSVVPVPANPDWPHSLAFHYSITAGKDSHYAGPYYVETGIAERWAAENLAASKLRPLRNNWDKDYCAQVLKNPSDKSIDATALRHHARSVYRPELADVLGCLLLDAEAVDSFHSWEEFAEEFGYLDGTTKSARKAQQTYAACLDVRRFLLRALGSRFSEFADAAREL